jgi:NodT family efflux transporter outer membrane factor (OMF) lipoprotein
MPRGFLLRPRSAPIESMSRNAVFGCILLLLAPAGCTVGPNFAAPAPPNILSHAADQNISSQWWELFGSADLTAMIEEALDNAPSLAAQQAALRAAQAQRNAVAGTLFPQFSGSADAARSSSAYGPVAVISNARTAQVNLAYTLDIWGGERRSVEEADAGVDQATYMLAASRLDLAANVAQTMILIASLHDQIEATGQILDEERQARELISEQVSVGAKTQADLLQQDALIAQTEVTLPPLAQQLDHAWHQLAALTGKEAAPQPQPVYALADFSLPHNVPAQLPAQLIQQRPDIQEEQAVLHQRSAAVGVATANLLPALTLQGAAGTETETFAGLAANGLSIWNIGLGLTQPLFEGGTLFALHAKARAELQQEAATYQQTVLNALADVDDNLSAVEHDRDLVIAADNYEQAAASSLAFTRAQYQIGATDLATLLLQQQGYQQARLDQIQAVGRQYQDIVALYQSLGGGWWTGQGAQR